jgi:hypothetical protein
VRVNAVAPGYVSTPRINELPENIISAFANSHPMKRMATMTEVADFILFLLSENQGSVPAVFILLMADIWLSNERVGDNICLALDMFRSPGRPRHSGVTFALRMSHF